MAAGAGPAARVPGLTRDRAPAPPRGDGRGPVVRVYPGQAPTAALSAAARSVCSQVNSGISRPKWPKAEVSE